MQTNQRVEIRSTLNNESIQRLVNDDIMLLVVKNYYPKSLAQKIASALIRSDSLERYTHELSVGDELRQEYLGVDRVGVPFNLIYDKSEEDPLVYHYYQSARHNMIRIREYAKPALTPIDKLRLELDETYSHGAMVASFQHKKMLAGIGRVSHAEMSHMSEDPPHFDAIPAKFASLTGQFAANIYLKVPESGGELEVWDVPSLTPLSEIPENWRQKLPESMRLKPETGDLVIFNCRKPHAIRRFIGEPRVTMQVFIGHQQNNPLQLWN